MKDKIKITGTDYVRLSALISTLKKSRNGEPDNLTVLSEEIVRAERVDPQQISPEVVTMNSTVEIVDLDTNKLMTVKLVYPKDADFKKGNVSILSLLGSALLGYKVGSKVSYKVPMGTKEMVIKNIVYQPESNGEYDV